MEASTPIVEVTAQTIDDSHIGCAIGNTPADRRRAALKKAWMKDAFAQGFRFFRLDARGKALIETVPAEAAWAPVQAPGWLYLECFWVSGRFKGQGHATALLQHAVAQARAQGKNGLVALATGKKRPFLSDGGFLRHQGFQLSATAPPDYELLALPLDPQAAPPRFGPSVGAAPPVATGLWVGYSHHCPHTQWVAEQLAPVAGRCGVPFAATCWQSAAQAQAAPNPFTTWALYYNGRFVTNELFTPAKLEKFLHQQAPQKGTAE